MSNISDDLDLGSSTDNLTYTTDYSCLYTQTFLLLCFCVISITIISNVFGNILILTSVIKFRSKFQGSLYVLISNLAVSDLLLGISMIMYPIESFFPGLANQKSFCYTRLCVLLVAFCSSILSLLLISIDRFVAVLFPMKHYRCTVEKARNIRITLVFVWVLSVIVGTLPVTANSKYHSDDFFCRNGLMKDIEIDLFNSSAFLVEFIASTVLYGIVICYLRNHSSQMTERTKRKLNIKTYRMVFVFIVYALCWLPHVITTFLLVTLTSKRSTVRCVREHLVLFGVLNSGINWIIYGLTNAKFRRAFKLTLTCNRQWARSAYAISSPLAAISNSSPYRERRHRVGPNLMEH